MHLLMIVLGMGTAWLLRATWQPSPANWSRRWQQALRRFVLPPLILFMTAIAVVCMKREGWMVFGSEGWIYVAVAIVYLGAIALLLLQLSGQSYAMHRRITRTYPQVEQAEQTLRLLDTPMLYSAQIGLWRPELVVSQGLLDSLDGAHLEAVLLHEQAHREYHDTFWFFWLGWLRRCTRWLPNTELLWQELLLLREIRADRWAAQQIDPLLLAEALVTVVRSPADFPPELCVAFGPDDMDRFSERIEAIIDSEAIAAPTQPIRYRWLLWGLLPLLLIPLHC